MQQSVRDKWLAGAAGIILLAALTVLLKGKEEIAESPSQNESPPPASKNEPAAPEKPAVNTPPQPPVDPKRTDPIILHPRSPDRQDERQRMVDQIRNIYGFKNPPVLTALNGVPRHWFVRPTEQNLAYADMPLPIGHGQTISQPFIVAYMTGLLDLTAEKKVLEVGTGSGYQAAVLTEFTPHVYSIEIVEPLAKAAQKSLTEHGYKTVQIKAADGYWGWEENAPFDAIIVTCASDHIPPALIKQLKPNGKMCIPVGGPFHVQNLMLVQKDSKGVVTSQSLMPVRFVPLTRKNER